MARDETNDETDDTVALTALGWLLAEPARFERFQALTGLDRDEIRGRIDDPALLAAILSHLTGHEPDMIACADAIGVPPGELAATQQRLEQRCAPY